MTFKIRIPAKTKFQVEDPEVFEEEDPVEGTSTSFLPVRRSEERQSAVENVSLRRSPEFSNVFLEMEDEYHVTDENDGNREPVAVDSEDIDSDSDSEYEYEEVTVTDDSECGDVDEGEEIPYDSRGGENQMEDKLYGCRDRDSSGLGVDEYEEVEAEQSDSEDDELVEVIEETAEEVWEDEGKEPAAKLYSEPDEPAPVFPHQQTLDLERCSDRLTDILDEEAEEEETAEDEEAAEREEKEEDEDEDEDEEVDVEESDRYSEEGEEEEVEEEEDVEQEMEAVDVEEEDDGDDQISSSSEEFEILEQEDERDIATDFEIGTADDGEYIFDDQLVPHGHEPGIEREADESKEGSGKEMRGTGDRTEEGLPNDFTESDNSRVVMFDHEIVRFVIKKSRKAVRITEIVDVVDSVVGREGEEMEEVETLASPPAQTEEDPQTSGIPVFTFKLRRSRTENAFEESGYDAEDEDETCYTDEGSSCSGNNEHAFATSGEEVEDDDEEDESGAFENRKRTKRADSFSGNESILAKVLVLLPFTERVKCESVSKTWNSAIKAVNGSHQSSLGMIGIRSRNERLQNFCPLPTHRVDHVDCVLITSSFDILSILKKVPNLLSLHLRCDGSANVFQDVETSAQLGELCPRLEHISVVDDIAGPDIYDHMMPMISKLNELRHIQLRFPCKSSTMVRENVLIRKCLDRYREKMEILSVNVPLHEDTCAYIANFCRLRKLSLHGTTIPMSGLVYLLERGNIRGKYIKCFNIVIDSKDQLQIITKNMVCLHSFHCVFSQFATKSLQPKDVQAIGRMKNLRTLFLSIWTNQLIDEGLIGIALGCRQLSSLTVNAEVSDQSVKYLGSFCPLLERLELNTTIPDLITDASIDSLLQLKQLRYLTLYFCDLSDEGIHRLLSATKDLELLSISFSRRITCKTIDIMSRFAEEKPWERVTLMLPKSLSKGIRWIHHDIPRNLEVSFNP